MYSDHSACCIQFIGGPWWSSIGAKGVHAAFGGLRLRSSFTYQQHPPAAIRTFMPIERASRTGGGHLSG